MNLKATIQRQSRRTTKVPVSSQGKQAGTAACLALSAVAASWLLVTMMPAFALQVFGLPQATLPAFGKGLTIFDRFDHRVCTIYGARNQQPLHLKDVSPNLRHAIIAAEDHDFYGHDGISAPSILRAVCVDVWSHHLLQGGSTISQQLVKNLCFEGKKRNLLDKIAEALMALDMERRYSKDAILEAYLNCVYFGDGAYGIESAAQQYFGKKAEALDPAQSAFVAGLINAPSELSLPENRQRAVARQQMILESMKELGYINDTTWEAARKQDLQFHPRPSGTRLYRYYTSEVIEQLKNLVGKDGLYDKGYCVYTYLDPQAQRLAERTLSAGVARAPAGINEGALVSLSLADGGVMAMVGGAGSYEQNQWNRATSPHTAGSAFKPFVYLAALSEGVLTPDTMLNDAPVAIKQPGAPVYRPRNFDGQFLGPMTIRKAIALSRNTCAVAVAQMVGAKTIVRYAQDAGITAKLDANLSLALGSSAVSPLEMATAYATLARGGQYLESRMIRKVADENAKVLLQFAVEPKQVFRGEPVAELVDALQDVVERGTGAKARLLDRPVAGKTGTADGARDIWFIGFTPDTVTAVWGGNEDNRPVIGHVTGGTVMASIWQSYMRDYYRQHYVPPGSFKAPEFPLAAESEPIHFLPSPADIFHRLFGPLNGRNEGTGYAASSANRRGQGAESVAKRPRKRSLLRRFLDWFDN